MRKGGVLSTAAGSDVRISKRHDAGALFEDFGTTLQTDSQNKRNPTVKRNKFTPSITKTSYSQTVTRQGTNNGRGGTGTNSSRKTASPDTRSRSDTIELSDSESDDELDLLSQKSSRPDPSTLQQRPPSMSSTSHGVRSNERVFQDAQGKKHPYHKDFQPRNLTGMKFNKIKEANQVAKTPQTSSQTSLPSPKSSLPLSHEDNSGGLMHSKRFQQSRMGDTVYVNHIGTQSRTTTHSKHGNIPLFSTTSESPTPTTNEPPRKSQPKPRPIGRSAHSRSQINPTSSVTVLNMLPVGSSPPRSKSPSRPRSQCLSPKATVKQPAAFPVPTPPTSPVTRSKKKKTNLLPISPLKESNSDDSRWSKPQASSSRLPEPFPVPSPYNRRKDEMDDWRGRTRPKVSKEKGQMKENEDGGLFTEPEDDSPTTTASKSMKGKGKETERLTAIVKGKDGKSKKPRKFPMSTQMLESIGSSPDPGLRRGKRSPDRGSDNDRVKKRSKTEEDSYSQSPSHAFEDEGDSILYLDPRSLCPYCDSRLPAQPSPLLTRLLASTKEKAKPDPRPSNPLGLKAPMAVFVSVCQRHRFESEILPEAHRKGWPKTIEWNTVAERVMKMKRALQALIDDTGEEDQWEVPYSQKGKEKSGRKGPKSSSIFWNEVMEEIKQKGTRAAAGVRGQFANFEKAQPGYYGEQGSVIINQTLYDMFPPSSMNSRSIAPLTGNEFMQKILVPEVALRLIMEDRNLRGEEGRQDALITLRESSTYGVFMFPEDGGEAFAKKSKGDRLGVGDRIVMERAMKRRKELEEEEQKEERLIAVEQQKMKATGKNCVDRREDVEVMQVDRVPPKPRPRPVGKASSTMSVASSQDNRRSTRHRSRSRSIYGDTDPASEIDITIEISDSDSSDRSIRVTRHRSPPTSRGRAQLSSTRSTTRSLAGMDIPFESESSSKAIVGGRWTRSRSRSIARLTGHEVHKVSEDDDNDDIFSDSTKTPTRRMDMGDNTDTPKTVRPSKIAKLPPLLQAQQRRQASVASEKGLLPQPISSRRVISIEESKKTKMSLPSRQNSANRVGSNAKLGDPKTPLPSRRYASNNVVTPKSKSGPQCSLSKESKSDDFKWLLDSAIECDPELSSIPV